jgi:hypothetical protein
VCVVCVSLSLYLVCIHLNTPSLSLTHQRICIHAYIYKHAKRERGREGEREREGDRVAAGAKEAYIHFRKIGTFLQVHLHIPYLRICVCVVCARILYIYIHVYIYAHTYININDISLHSSYLPWILSVFPCLCVCAFRFVSLTLYLTPPTPAKQTFRAWSKESNQDPHGRPILL